MRKGGANAPQILLSMIERQIWKASSQHILPRSSLAAPASSLMAVERAGVRAEVHGASERARWALIVLHHGVLRLFLR